jgi:hypothetical protein
MVYKIAEINILYVIQWLFNLVPKRQGIDSKEWIPPAYVAGTRIFKRLWSPGIDSKEWISPQFLAPIDSKKFQLWLPRLVEFIPWNQFLDPTNIEKYGLWNIVSESVGHKRGWGGRGRGGRGGLRGIGGGMISHLELRVQMFTICAQNSPETTHSSLFWGVGRGVYIPRNRSSVRLRFWKTNQRDWVRVCAKFEIPRRFRGSSLNQKKRLVDAEASPSIHASIHRSLVPPTALVATYFSLQSSRPVLLFILWTRYRYGGTFISKSNF